MKIKAIILAALMAVTACAVSCSDKTEPSESASESSEVVGEVVMTAFMGTYENGVYQTSRLKINIDDSVWENTGIDGNGSMFIVRHEESSDDLDASFRLISISDEIIAEMTYEGYAEQIYKADVEAGSYSEVTEPKMVPVGNTEGYLITMKNETENGTVDAAQYIIDTNGIVVIISYSYYESLSGTYEPMIAEMLDSFEVN